MNNVHIYTHTKPQITWNQPNKNMLRIEDEMNLQTYLLYLLVANEAIT